MLEADKVISWEEMPNVASRIDNEKDRALFVFEYLSGGRVGEIVKKLKKSQLENRNIEGAPFLVITDFYTEKNKQSKERTLPIPIRHEEKMINLAQNYIDTIEYDGVLFPFSRTTAWRHIRKIVLKVKEEGKKGEPVIKEIINDKLVQTNKNRKRGKMHMNANHYLRHCRATHLVTKYGYGEFELMQFMGWSDTRPAGRYTHLMVGNLAKKMM